MPVDFLITLVHSFLFFPFFSLNQSFTSLVPAEVSDQNFIDEDRVEKSLSRAKRLKMATADASTKDQVNS